MSQHQAKFTWGAGPNVVAVAGNFNSWSADATPLHKQPDGSFAAEISLPWGEKQAFKYVVDGEWKVREDEAKEWDAAGNMNNVYTAPHAPAAASEPAKPVPAAADSPAVPVVAAAGTKADTTAKEDVKTKEVEPATEEPSKAAAAAVPVPASTTDDTAPAATKSTPTEPSTLLASNAPAPASSGNPYNLGKPIGGTQPAPVTTLTNADGAEPVKATAAVPLAAAPAVSDPTPVQIEKTAANANIGAAPAQTDDEKTIQETVAEYGAGAFAAIGAVAGGALAAVEKATGVDLTHGNPLTVDEAKAQGIDLNAAEKKELNPTATSPVGTKPPLSAVDALEEKVQELKKPVGESATGPTSTAAVPLPNGEAPKSSYADAPAPVSSEPEQYSKHDIPAQDEVDNHQHVPATVITPVSAKDPRKDRSLEASNNDDTAGTKPISADPSISAKDAKKEAEVNPGGTGSTPDAAQGKVTAASTPADGGAAHVAPGEAVARPDATNTNKVDSPPTPAKDSTPIAPATPAKSAAVAGPDSVNSTPASTPAKSAHTKEGTANSDVRKRKSSFFTKIKHAFSPKDKEKK